MRNSRKPSWMKEGYHLEQYGIGGTRLLLALDIIRYCWAGRFPGSSYRGDVDKKRGWSEAKVKKELNRIRAGLLLRGPETIYEGDHRGGQSVGLRPLHDVLKTVRNLRCVVFDLSTVVNIFLGPWLSIVRSIAPNERTEFWNFFDAIRSGELTEEDLKE